MRQINVFGAEEADTAGTHGDRGSGVGRAVDVRKELEGAAIGRLGRHIAIGCELVLEVEKLAFELQVGAALLGVWVDEQVATAAIDHERVAGLDVAQNAANAGNGGD